MMLDVPVVVHSSVLIRQCEGGGEKKFSRLKDFRGKFYSHSC